MTLKKSNKAQAIFEYFILTTVVVAVVLFFANSRFFARQKPGDPLGIKDICEAQFDKAVANILR